MGSRRGDSGPSAGATAVGRLGVTEPLWTVPVLERAAGVAVPQLAGPEDDSVLGASQEPGPPRPCTSVHPAERVASPTAGSGEGPPKPRVSPPALRTHRPQGGWYHSVNRPVALGMATPASPPPCVLGSLILCTVCGPESHTQMEGRWRPRLHCVLRAPDLQARPTHGSARALMVTQSTPGVGEVSPGETSRHDQVHGTQRVRSSCPQGEEVDQQAQGVCAGTRRGWQEAAGGGL